MFCWLSCNYSVVTILVAAILEIASVSFHSNFILSSYQTMVSYIFKIRDPPKHGTLYKKHANALVLQSKKSPKGRQETTAKEEAYKRYYDSWSAASAAFNERNKDIYSVFGPRKATPNELQLWKEYVSVVKKANVIHQRSQNNKASGAKFSSKSVPKAAATVRLFPRQLLSWLQLPPPKIHPLTLIFSMMTPVMTRIYSLSSLEPGRQLDLRTLMLFYRLDNQRNLL
jgi:hypothetical protein